MKKFFWTFLVLLPALQAGAQVTAITEEGRAVVLFGNGTWRYAHDSVYVTRPDLPRFTVPVRSASRLRGRTVRYEIWYNAEKWHLIPDSVYPDTDYALEDKNGETIAMIITERIQVPLVTIREAAIESFQNKNAEYRITEEQNIVVNGTEGLLLSIDALVENFPVTYLNGYFSTPAGTFQIITYTAYNLFDRHRSDMMELISGFVLKDR